MAKRKKKGDKPDRNRESPGAAHLEMPTDSRPVAQPQVAPDGRELPKWIAAEGNLYWRGRVILHLATHATEERDILDAFHEEGWKQCILNPIARDMVGDPTQSRRSAIWNLNHHQGERAPIRFFSAEGGFVGWRKNL